VDGRRLATIPPRKTKSNQKEDLSHTNQKQKKKEDT